jgi:hypothetical protein
MMPAKTRTPKVKAFVHPPFVRCPDCGTDNFGVLMIGAHQYTRRCIHCWFDKRFPLPVITKRVIYLDQFVISNMMKELDPDTPESSKGANGGFYLKLFERLDRLAKLQLVVCPNSPLQDHESAVDPRYLKLRTVFRHLSNGVGLRPPVTIFHAQLLRAFRGWIKSGAEIHQMDADFVFTGDRNAWQDHLRIDLNYQVPGLVDSLRRTSAELTQHLREVCKYWQEAPNLTFNEVYARELASLVKRPWREYLSYIARLAAVQLGEAALAEIDYYPPHSSTLISHMLGDLRTQTQDSKAAHDKIEAFFDSETARAIPYARISALFWATLARDVRSGRNPDNFPSASICNDIDMVATYSPFCEALFVDKEVSHLATQAELKRELAGVGKIFSLREGERAAFMAYLDRIEADAPREHLDIVEALYGPDWTKPYVGLLAKRTSAPSNPTA